jgi:hypothetical protein
MGDVNEGKGVLLLRLLLRPTKAYGGQGRRWLPQLTNDDASCTTTPQLLN